MLCLWSDQSEVMDVFFFFNLWNIPGFIFESFVNFKFFYSHFPITAFGLDLFSGAYLNKFTGSLVPDD